MRLTYDWIASTPAERAVNFVLRPFGLDCFVERHRMASWQWGIELPSGGHSALHIWCGPLHAMIERV